MANPKVDDSKVDDAAEAAMERVRARHAGKQEPTDDGDVVTGDEDEIVELRPPSDDDDDDDDAKSDKPSAGQRRSERGRNFREETEARLKQAEDRAARAEENSANIARLVGSVVQQPRQQQEPQGIPEDAELAEVYQDWREREEAFNARWHGKNIPPEEQARAHAIVHQLRTRESEIMFRRNQRLFGGAPGITAEQAELAAIQAPIRDLLNHPNQKVRIDFETGFKRAVHVEGRPNTAQELHKYADEIRRKYGMLPPERRPASQATRQRLSGQSRGSSGGDEGNVKVRVTEHIRTSAVEAYPRLSQEKAVERWMKRHGRSYASKVSASGGRAD